MKDFFKKHIYDPGDGKPGTQSVPPPVQTGQTPQHQMPGGVSTATTTGYVDQGMLADIQKVISRRQTPFSKLEADAAQLAPVIPDEMTRTKAAFQMQKGTGVAAAQVISSIDLHIRDIETEKTNFVNASQGVARTRVGSLRTEIEQLSAQNTHAEQTISQLQQQIQALQTGMAERAATISQKSVEAATAESDIQMKVNQFTGAADSVVATLKSKQMQLSAMLA